MIGAIWPYFPTYMYAGIGMGVVIRLYMLRHKQMKKKSSEASSSLSTTTESKESSNE
jgi:hypothetical protein